MFTLFRSLAYRVTKKLPVVSSKNYQSSLELTLDTTNTEDYCSSSPTSASTETRVFSSMMKRLGELEEKVNTLKSKPSELPRQKIELLNAAVYRVDALEAELIAAKKVRCCSFALRYIL
jgi:predicted transcriptional regulator